MIFRSKTPLPALLITGSLIAGAATVQAGKLKHIDPGSNGSKMGEVRVSGLFVRSISTQMRTKRVVTQWDENGNPRVLKQSTNFKPVSVTVVRPSLATAVQEVLRPIKRPVRLAALYFGNHDRSTGLQSLGFGKSKGSSKLMGSAYIKQPTSVGGTQIATNYANAQGRSTSGNTGGRLIALRNIFGKGSHRVEDTAHSDPLTLRKPRLHRSTVSLREPALQDPTRLVRNREGNLKSRRVQDQNSRFPRFFGRIFGRNKGQ